MCERLNRNEARKLLAKLMSSGAPIRFIFHALEELKKDGMKTGDALNILKSPSSRIEEGELRNGSYTYRVVSTYMVVVISFCEKGESVTVVTAWDKRNKGN